MSKGDLKINENEIYILGEKKKSNIKYIYISNLILIFGGHHVIEHKGFINGLYTNLKIINIGSSQNMKNMQFENIFFFNFQITLLSTLRINSILLLVLKLLRLSVIKYAATYSSSRNKNCTQQHNLGFEIGFCNYVLIKKDICN